MESISIFIGIIGFVSGVLSYLNTQKLRKSISNLVGEQLANSVKTLDPNKRYIVSLPGSMTEEEFDAAFGVMRDFLDLETSQTHIVIMHGDVKMIEFS